MTFQKPHFFCIVEQKLPSHANISFHSDLFWEQRYKIFAMPDSFQEEVDDLLPLFPLPEHSLDEWMKDSKYNGVLVNEVHHSFFKPERKCNSPITRPLFSEELLDIYCLYTCVNKIIASGHAGQVLTLECSWQFSINMNLFLCTMPHFFSKLLWKLCQRKHWELAWLFCTGEHTQLPRICCVATWKRCVVVLRFFVYVQFFFYFVLLALNCAHLGKLQYWLGCTCKREASKHTQIHMLLFFHKDETTTHLPYDMQQSMCYTFKAGSQQLLAIQVANTKQIKIWSNIFRPADLMSCITRVPMHAPRAINFKHSLCQRYFLQSLVRTFVSST